MVLGFLRAILYRTINEPQNIDRLSRTPVIRYIARMGVYVALKAKTYGFKFLDKIEKSQLPPPKKK